MKIRKLNIFTGVLVPLTLVGCAKKNECGTNGYHLHKYVKDNGLVRYEENENDFDSLGFKKQDDYVLVDKRDYAPDLYKFEYENDLMLIDENIDYLYSFGTTYPTTFKEYEYAYNKTYTCFDENGVPSNKLYQCLSWTTDSERNGLTGKSRDCYYEYRAYRIVREKDSKEYRVEASDATTDILDILDNKDEYPYVKVNFYKVLDTKTNNMVSYSVDGMEEPNIKIKSYNNR